MVHRPTEQDRARVVMLCTTGCQQDRIGDHLGIDAKTLRKHYAQELGFGTEILLTKVVANLASIAIHGKGSAAVSACKYILGCRGGWRDVSHIEVEPTGVGVAAMMMTGSDNAREIIAAKLDALAARHAQRAARDAELEAASLPRPPLDS